VHMFHVARHVKTSFIELKMYLTSNGERIESRFDGVVDVFVWAAMARKLYYVRSTLGKIGARVL